MVRTVSGLLLLLLSVSCANDCQDLCQELAEYATECELVVSDTELEECKTENQRRDLEDGEMELCEEFNDPEVIREEWTCSDLEEYWAP